MCDSESAALSHSLCTSFALGTSSSRNFCDDLFQADYQLPTFPCSAFASVDFKSVMMISLVSQYNALLDLSCKHHIVRDRHLFCSYVEKSISVGTSTCGSLEALGIGDVDFWYPFHDRHVIFTMHGCLYVSSAPINLLSLGTLVEHGMSYLLSPGGITIVFYTENHAKFPGLTFSTAVTNHLSFLKLDFLSPLVSEFSTLPAQALLLKRVHSGDSNLSGCPSDAGVPRLSLSESSCALAGQACNGVFPTSGPPEIGKG